MINGKDREYLEALKALEDYQDQIMNKYGERGSPTDMTDTEREKMRTLTQRVDSIDSPLSNGGF